MKKIILSVILTISIGVASSENNSKLNIELNKAIYKNAPIKKLKALIDDGADINADIEWEQFLL